MFCPECTKPLSKNPDHAEGVQSCVGCNSRFLIIKTSSGDNRILGKDPQLGTHKPIVIEHWRLPVNIIDIIKENKIIESTSKIRELIIAGAIKLGDQKITSFDQLIIEKENNLVLHIGKKNHCQIKVVDK